MACRPATPTPTTSTFAALTVPAAVMNIGNIFGSVSAARRTALYPATVAIDDRASMLWARVIRGISSIEKLVTPRSAISRAASAADRGSERPMMVCPDRIRSRSERPASGLAPSDLTCRITSADPKTSDRRVAIRAPFASYAVSRNPASRPAPASTRTSKPCLVRLGTESGTIATRRSLGNVSLQIPIFMVND